MAQKNFTARPSPRKSAPSPPNTGLGGERASRPSVDFWTAQGPQPFKTVAARFVARQSWRVSSLENVCERLFQGLTVDPQISISG